MQNPTGLAVGGIITAQGVTYVVLPGPPSELKPMVNQELIPALLLRITQVFIRVLRFFRRWRKSISDCSYDFIVNQTDPTIAPYAKVGK